jgi:hypothetical protein
LDKSKPFTMERMKILSLVTAGLVMGCVACNNSSETSANPDSSNTGTTTNVATGNYAARADSVRTNVQAGYYLNPRTGRAYTTLNVDPNTGSLTDETGAVVKRYVDKRSWWVYDTNSWDTVGSAQMSNGQLMYRGTEGDWQTYDKRWTDDMDTNMNSGSMSDTASMNGNNSKVKIKTDDGKLKSDEKGVKVKPKNQ